MGVAGLPLQLKGRSLCRAAEVSRHLIFRGLSFSASNDCFSTMIDAKMLENGLANNGTSGLPACDKQQLLLEKKTALREIQNEAENIIKNPLGNPLSKDTGFIANTVKLCGNKRPKPECPSSPTYSCSPCNNINGTNGLLVYPLKQAEQIRAKMNSCDIVTSESSQSRQPNNDVQEPHVLYSQILEPKFYSPAFAPMPLTSLSIFSGGALVPHSLGRGSIGFPISELNHLVGTHSTGTLSGVNPHSVSNLNWKERFLQLQMYLKRCDESSQEEIIKRLRGLSADGRSRLAVELEKRAINLLLEEGKELQRMRALNVLGNSVPVNNASPASQAHVMQQVEK